MYIRLVHVYAYVDLRLQHYTYTHIHTTWRCLEYVIKTTQKGNIDFVYAHTSVNTLAIPQYTCMCIIHMYMYNVHVHEVVLFLGCWKFV